MMIDTSNRAMSAKERKLVKKIMNFEDSMRRLETPYILAAIQDYGAKDVIVSGSVPTEETLDLIVDIIRTISDTDNGITPLKIGEEIMKRLRKKCAE